LIIGYERRRRKGKARSNDRGDGEWGMLELSWACKTLLM